MIMSVHHRDPFWKIWTERIFLKSTTLTRWLVCCFLSSRNLQLPQFSFHQLVDQPALRGQTGLKQKWNYYTHLKRICLCLLRKLHRPWYNAGRLRPHCLGASCKEIRACTVQEELWGKHRVAFSGVWLYGPDSILRQLWFRPFCPVTWLSADHHRRWKRHRCNSAAEIAGVLLSDPVPVHCYAVGVKFSHVVCGESFASYSAGLTVNLVACLRVVLFPAVKIKIRPRAKCLTSNGFFFFLPMDAL